MRIVWFKRDLRVNDHLALTSAAKEGDLLLLYIIEPQLWQQPDMSYRQYEFLCECLLELKHQLQAIGHNLVIKVGEAAEVFASLHQKSAISSIWSHQETWNGWTYKRDLDIKTWTETNQIPWHEFRQNGVIRALKTRNGWAKKWYQYMTEPALPVPEFESVTGVSSDQIPTSKELMLEYDHCDQRQQGGRSQALRYLTSFLDQRGQFYIKQMSSPVTAFESCSRLSPYLAFGVVSVREVFQFAETKNNQIKQWPRGNKSNWSRAVNSFSSRLRWHCHFMQKLEDEPKLEYRNLHFAYNGLRENNFDQKLFEAWKAGKTGYPLVDACMRALIATGWLNFRMRAMLMSFASQHLWLHWRLTSIYLASLFTDYEPGIHYSQAQMQSGTTGINSIRIYNPIKQSYDQDPDGDFIRQWIPELADMPNSCIHTPWVMPSKLGGYPLPVVDEVVARRAAADNLYKIRKSNEHLNEANKIVKKHASRKRVRTKRTKAKPANPKQPSLF